MIALNNIGKILGQKLFGLSLYTLVCCVGFIAHAQTTTVKGTVVGAEDGQPIPGVNVLIEGTAMGSSTDFDGFYSIEVPDGATLVFSYIGMMETKVLVSQATHNVVLETSTTGLDEVIVVGYGTMKKRELTGAVASVKSEDIVKTATSDFASSLQGRMAGVSVRQGNSAPGENAQITIRGITSFQEGGSGPLYVVDGVTYIENPNITPQEIESIEVLKDGASASIYGSRASGGVILITTKKGKEGSMNVSLDSYYGVQNINSGIALANTTESLYINDILYRYQETNQFNPLDFNKDGLLFNTDWMGDLQVDMAPIQNHSVSVSGGKNGLTYNVIGTYFSQDGSLYNSDYEKYSLRSNTYFKKNKFSAQANLSVNVSDQNREPYALIYDAIRLQPYRRPLDASSDSFTIGGTSPENISNFAGKLKQENESKINSFNGNVRLNYELIDGLRLGANLGKSYYSKKDRFFNPSFIIYNEEGVENPTASNYNAQLRLGDGTNNRSIAEFTLNYNKSFKKHHLKVLVGNTYEKASYEFYRTGADNISNNITPVLGNGEPIVATHFINKTNSISYLARVNYNYNWKYMLTAVVRRDGSSNFGTTERYGVFPSISGAWTISNESFFSGLKDKISMAKIRIGYGTTGSDRIPPYAFSPVVISNVDYPLGGGSNLASGMTQPGYADPNLKWESNISKNFGIDLDFQRGKAGLVIDIYEQDKKDMLLAIVPPISAGSTPVSGQTYDRFLTNIGNLQNKGIEIAGHLNQDFGDVQVKFGATFTKNENTVISLSREGEFIFDGYPNIVRTGQTEPVAVLEAGLPVGAFKVYETAGTIKTDAELSAYQQLVPTAQKGDLRYVDADGDGSLTANDKVYKGSYQPDFEYGFTIDMDYKAFDLSVQLYGVEGSTIYNGAKQFAYSMKRHRDLVYSWTDLNPTSNIPTPRSNIEHPNVQTSTDLFLEDGSFLRVRNIILGYSLQEDILKKIGVDNLRIYVSAQNPITFTNYTGFDPEVGSNNPFTGGLDRGNYPVSATYLTGLSISF
ncbi:MAG: TonB-dependent receptor [Flavobacteriaceae bacterium]